jgi:THO complex subunit 2
MCYSYLTELGSFVYYQLKYDALRKADPNCKKLSPSAKHQKYCEAAGEVMSPIVASVRPLHPPKVWEDISPQFLVTFWSLTMYDLFVPNDCYQREINKLKQLSLQVMDSKDMVILIFIISTVYFLTKRLV